MGPELLTLVKYIRYHQCCVGRCKNETGDRASRLFMGEREARLKFELIQGFELVYELRAFFGFGHC